MPTLLLIRHGENDFVKQARLPGRLPGIHLNEHGQEQAAALAESLKNLPIRAIYASPLERAVETAEPLAQALGLPIQLRPGLLDTDVGEWQGLQFKKLRKLPLWKQVQQQPSRSALPGRGILPGTAGAAGQGNRRASAPPTNRRICSPWSSTATRSSWCWRIISACPWTASRNWAWRPARFPS